MARRRSRSAPTRRAGSVLLDTAPARRRRRRGRRRGYGRRDAGFGRARWGRRLAVLVLLAAVVAGALAWRARSDAADARREAVERFAAAWEENDLPAMWRTLSPAARRAVPERRFVTAYRNAQRAAGVRRVRTGRLGAERDGRIALPVAIRTDIFKTLRGRLAIPVSGSGEEAGVDWDFSLRMPGLRRDEAVVRESGRPPRRAPILAANGRRLDATPLGASLAGRSGSRPTGLERVHDDRLGGHAQARLLFGKRVIARTRAVRGRPVRTFFDPGLASAAEAALGGKVGGVAVLRPRDGAVLGLAGLAVSAPQPPGSTFKVITTAAALERRIVEPSTSYPVQTGATLSGVTLRNAGGEACGGTLQHSFAESCNSVFAPLGAKLGARRLVAAARAFGFGEKPRIPAAKTSTISAARELEDDLAVGSAAIGQEKDLATPLAMASVAATIAADGRRAVPRVAQLDKVIRRRAVSRRAARQVRSMMIDVVRSGTGTSGAVPGVTVAGKTGTAELRPNSSDPRDADAWFLAFAPAERPRVAVAVMLVGAGFGGTAAAPVARDVIEAALR
ncbi:MAG TPA: penicillin-binding transpeptidase domain-containing protein [Solirubrobacteraceae bacterium]|nr:penicillin-binding transpeptidase domain-containing protein [Solirubrobacteraceae bacterium]